MLSLALNGNLGRQVLRYSLTGGFNTVIGFAVIMAFLAIGFEDVPANLAGYAVGLLISFFVNRQWTFAAATHPDAREVFKFLGSFAVAYGANLAVILIGQSIGFSGSPFLHLVGVITYSSVGFLLARNYVYATTASSKAFGPIGAKGIAIICITIACAIFPGMSMTHDVVWQFWIARQMNHGVELYSQINEVNPPLWFWMAMPLEFIGRRVGVNPILLVQFAMILLAAMSCLIAGRLLPKMNGAARGFFLVNAFGLALFLGYGNFAQREQIAMIVALPYILLLVRRAEGEPISFKLALATGVFAAAGFALKHYFIAVPLLFEVWLIFKHRSRYRPLRPETLALLALAVIYALSVVAFTPGFVSKQIPMIMAAYEGYKKPLASLFNDREQLIWLFAVVAFIRYAWKRTLFLTPLTIGFLIASLGFFFGYVAQGKGWVYHSMPVSYFLLLAIIAAVFNFSKSSADHRPHYLACIALALGYILPVSAGAYNNRYGAATEAAAAGTPKGAAVYILTSDAQKGWPMVVDSDYVWTSRFMGLWMMPAIATGLGDKRQLENLSVRVRNMIMNDLQCNPPATLLVDRAVINSILKPLDFDFMSFLLEHPEARTFMRNYDLTGTNKKFDIYKLRKGSRIARPVECRKIY